VTGERDVTSDSLAPSSSPPAAAHSIPSLEGPCPEGLLQPAAHFLEIDPDRSKRLRILLFEPDRWSLAHEPHDVGPNRVSLDPQPIERAPCHARGFTEKAQEEVLRADVPVAQIPRLTLGVDDHVSSPLGEPFEHRVYFRRPRNRRPACFLCTACLLTWSSLAISCHDQSKLRAFWTWIVSSCSTNRRRATTARSPTRGSRLLAWSAIFVACVMRVNIH
jgi:hypothetical protein